MGMWGYKSIWGLWSGGYGALKRLEAEAVRAVRRPAQRLLGCTQAWRLRLLRGLGLGL
jgi:hypothetical protein